MLYLDEYYKYDCENKIKYDHLKEIQASQSVGGGKTIGDYVFNTTAIYTDQDRKNPIYIVFGGTNFYTKNVLFCKEIAPNMYKVSLNPYVPAKKVVDRQNRILHSGDSNE